MKRADATEQTSLISFQCLYTENSYKSMRIFSHPVGEDINLKSNMSTMMSHMENLFKCIFIDPEAIPTHENSPNTCLKTKRTD